MRRPCRTPQRRQDRLQPGTSFFFFYALSYIFLRSVTHRASYANHPPLYLSIPKSAIGQTRNTIFPTICSPETQPTVVLRESTEVDR